MSESKTIVNPPYYMPGSLYEPFKVIAAWGSSYHVGSALKYLCRHGKKDGNAAAEDLRKAITHLEAEINRLEPPPYVPTNQYVIQGEPTK